MERKKKQAFTQSYGAEHLDASVLLMEPYGFIDAKDTRYVKTVKAIERELSHENFYLGIKMWMILELLVLRLQFVPFGL